MNIYAVNQHTPDGVVVTGFYLRIDDALNAAAATGGTVTSELTQWWPGAKEVLS